MSRLSAALAAHLFPRNPAISRFVICGVLLASATSLAAQFPLLESPQSRPIQEPSRQAPASAPFAPNDRSTLPRSASAPASRPGEFQPGVTIDWASKAVVLRASVVLRGGPIEFLACRPGKEHESLLLLEANAAHIFMALGLIGLEPGRPPIWDEKNQQVREATGDLLDVSFSWSEEGKTRSAGWTEWILDAEFLRRPVGRPLVFAGSILRPDRTIACERSGAVLALVDMPDSLISPARSRSEREADLWALANPAALPPAGTEVQVVIRAAEARRWEFSINARGDVLVDGRIERIEEVIELIRHQRRFFPNEPVAIQSKSPLRSDEWRILERLKDAGIAETSVRIVPPASSAP